MRICLPGTQEYKDRVATWKISPAQASAIESGIGSPGLEPGVLVGHFYVFSLPEKSDWRLQGVYIDGETGGVGSSIRSRREEKSLREPLRLPPMTNQKPSQPAVQSHGKRSQKPIHRPPTRGPGGLLDSARTHTLPRRTKYVPLPRSSCRQRRASNVGIRDRESLSTPAGVHCELCPSPSPGSPIISLK